MDDYLNFINLHLPNSPHTFVAASTTPINLWHARLGHTSIGCLHPLASSGKLGSVSISNNVNCLSCQLGKQPTLCFNKSDYTSVSPFDLIHSDIWGPSPHPTIGGCVYFIIFIDDYSRFT